jgi:tRNA-specific 2-thiouridylase
MGSRIAVAMSGGVDSSTAAALLREQGHEVIGVTLKLYDARGTARSLGGRCCTPRDIDDARRVCACLGVPHYVLDEREAFGRHVIDEFVAAYRGGQTPSPCVRCNQHLKFGPLVRFARAIGASALATGHYARVERRAGATARIRRALDRDKDQSYFLFAVRPELFELVRFPLGDLEKSEVRRLAHAFDLPTADKPDSQQLCFVPDGDHRAFIEARAGAVPGEVVDEAGRRIGTHGGIHQFTIGQRKGVPARGGEAARFVVRIDPSTGRVHVGPRDHLGRTELALTDVHWLEPPPEGALACEAQLRHHARAHAGEIVLGPEATATLRFPAPVEAPGPGQAAVLYRDDTLLGGGFIAG